MMFKVILILLCLVPMTAMGDKYGDLYSDKLWYKYSYVCIFIQFPHHERFLECFDNLNNYMDNGKMMQVTKRSINNEIPAYVYFCKMLNSEGLGICSMWYWEYNLR